MKHRILLHADACVTFAKSDGDTDVFQSLFTQPDALPALSQIAQLYREFGRLKQTEMFLSSILRSNPAEHYAPLFYECQRRLADVLVVEGRHEEAEQLYRAAIPFLRELAGCEHPNTLAAEAGLGRVFWHECRYTEAEVAYDGVIKTLTVSSGTLGILGREVASNLGLVYWHQGRLKEAEASFRRVLDELEAASEPNELAFLEPQYRLAMILTDLGQWTAAEAVFTKVFTERQKLLGLENLDTTRSANVLGRLYCFQGKYEKARKLLDLAWKGQEKLHLGTSHPAMLRTLFNIGVLNREQGMYDEAFECLERASLWQEKKYGERQHSHLLCLTELAVLKIECGEPREALTILARVRRIQMEDLPPEKPDCIRAVKAVGDAHVMLGELEQAEAEFALIAALADESLGRDTLDTLKLHVSMARLRFLQGRGREVLSDLQHTVQRVGLAVGPEHQVTLTAVSLLGQIYRQTGRQREGKEHMERAVRGMRETLGSAHPKTEELAALTASEMA